MGESQPHPASPRLTARATPLPSSTATLAKRKEDLRRLVNEKTRLRQQEKNIIASTDKDSLLTAGDGKSYGRETGNTRDLNLPQLQERAQLEMKAQDEILDVMSAGLVNLKNMGVAIKDEADLHMVRVV